MENKKELKTRYSVTKEGIKYAKEHCKDVLAHPEKYTDEQCAEIAANMIGDTILNACKPKYKSMSVEDIIQFINNSSKQDIDNVVRTLRKKFDECVSKEEFDAARAIEIAATALRVWYDARNIIGFERKYKS